MRIAQGDSIAATAVLNTDGNVGGWIGIPVVAALSWLWVDVAKPLADSKLLLEPTFAANAAN
jgi:hypothetical protein